MGRRLAGKGAGLRGILLAVAVLTAAASLPVAAQTVTGTVVEADGSVPLSGVLVSLIDSDGERVAATLSDQDGSFSLDAGRFGRFRLRAERIGLQSNTSETFDLFSTDPREERISMGQRAIVIDGLVVDSRVEQCRLDRDNAVQIQRWWQEIRTALDVSSAVQTEGLARVQVERYERAWTSDLSRVVSEAEHAEVGLSSRPFVSAGADFLAEGGFVQGALEGEREYYAPDADVLLSDVFLARHCFSLASHYDDELLGLAFEPTEEGVPDVRGTLWVDTTTAELQTLDFRYANLDDVPDNESGGFVSFEYRPSGAWIVQEWYIRMPRLARRPSGEGIVLAGYVDVGGRAVALEATSSRLDPDGGIGAVRGVVFDSVAGRPLAGATVSILGTGQSVLTDDAGEFIFPSVAAGEHRLTFSHPELAAWGLGASLVPVEVDEHRTADVDLGVPGFRTVASAVCQGSGLGAEAVLVGNIVRADGVGMGGVSVMATWPPRDGDRGDDPRRHDTRTDPDGRFVACTLPAQIPVAVDMHIDGVLVRAFEVTIPMERVVYRRVQVPG